MSDSSNKCYLCGGDAPFKLKSGNWCCSLNVRGCKAVKEKLRCKAINKWKELKDIGITNRKDIPKTISIYENNRKCFSCGEEGKYRLKNGKWSCEDGFQKCRALREKRSKKCVDRIRNGTTQNSFDGFNKRRKECEISSWNKGKTKETDERLKKAGNTFKERIKSGKIKIVGRCHSEKTIKTLSDKRKKWLKDNPDKHPWKFSKKLISAPCEKFKKFLLANGYVFEQEFSDFKCWNRHFSIDIAFTKLRIGIEINGNQHYERDGRLKPYYQERKEIIESSGWKIIDIHYSLVYNKKFCIEIVKQHLPIGTCDIEHGLYEI